MKRKPCNTCASLRAAWRAIKGDGCTAVPDLHYASCCNKHDKAYRTGVNRKGRPTTRLKADLALASCIMREKSSPIFLRILIAPTFFIGVRIFGGQFWRGK
jgi:hypothetical protein